MPNSDESLARQQGSEVVITQGVGKQSAQRTIILSKKSAQEFDHRIPLIRQPVGLPAEIRYWLSVRRQKRSYGLGLVVAVVVMAAASGFWFFDQDPVAHSLSNQLSQTAPEEDIQVVDILQSPSAPPDPDSPALASHQDHRTDQQTVVAPSKNRQMSGRSYRDSERDSEELSGQQKPKAALATRSARERLGSVDKSLDESLEQEASTFPLPLSPSPSPSPSPFHSSPKTDDAEGRSPYERFLASSQDVIARHHSAYVPIEGVGSANQISLNTRSYKHMGYFMKLRESIESVWSFPVAARYGGMAGSVQVLFKIGRDGQLMDVRVLESSGYRVLDDEVVNSLKRAAPFDPLPSSWQEKELEITGLFSYIYR